MIISSGTKIDKSIYFSLHLNGQRTEVIQNVLIIILLKLGFASSVKCESDSGVLESMAFVCNQCSKRKSNSSKPTASYHEIYPPPPPLPSYSRNFYTSGVQQYAKCTSLSDMAEHFDTFRTKNRPQSIVNQLFHDPLLKSCPCWAGLDRAGQGRAGQGRAGRGRAALALTLDFVLSWKVE